MATVARLFAVTVDCPKPLALARFYQLLTGGEIDQADDDFVTLTGGGGVRIGFRRVGGPGAGRPGEQAARWVNLELQGGADAEVRALERGAALAAHQPGGRRFRVLIDPAGHSFRLVNRGDDLAGRENDRGGSAGDAPEIRDMREGDAERVLAIYQAGLDGGQASFETAAPTWEYFDNSKLEHHRHVAVDHHTGEVLGWVAVSPTSTRAAYKGVVEHSVYVDPAARGRGIGGTLLKALIASTEAAGLWTLQAGVFPENGPSLRLHERAGFRVIGTRERVGRHHGQWRDVVLIERRSAVAGTG